MLRLHKILISIIFMFVCTTAIAISDAEIEAQASRDYAKMRAEWPLEKDRATIEFVHCVTTAIVESLKGPEREMNWELAIFKSKDANAFVMPGGKIGVFTGILDVATNQDQLAAVLGHEVAHVIARHPHKRQSRKGLTKSGIYIAAIILGQGHRGLTHTAYESLNYGTQVALTLPHTRKQESEADILGLEYMAKAGFDPRESIELWKKMQKDQKNSPPEFLSTHPSSHNRMDGLIKQYPSALRLMNEAKAQGKNPNCTR